MKVARASAPFQSRRLLLRGLWAALQFGLPVDQHVQYAPVHRSVQHDEAAIRENVVVGGIRHEERVLEEDRPRCREARLHSGSYEADPVPEEQLATVARP